VASYPGSAVLGFPLPAVPGTSFAGTTAKRRVAPIDEPR
jgi:hypothetical protein